LFAGRLVPVAVGRIPVAVGGLADSGIVLRLTRGRLWIGFLAALLIGIVALNVLALSFSASSSRGATAADELSRQNSALRAQIARELSNSEVQQAATRLGLTVPDPGAIGYLSTSADDAATAAKRLRSGQLTLGTSSLAAVAATTTVDTTVPTIAPPIATTPAVDPAATATTTDPAATAPVVPTEPTTTTDPATAGTPAGGVTAP
jgi:hypothetical protein